MLPPDGFTERAVAEALAEITAAEALRPVALSSVTLRPETEALRPHNDTAPRPPRKRRDSGIIDSGIIDDTPTLPFIRAAAGSPPDD